MERSEVAAVTGLLAITILLNATDKKKRRKRSLMATAKSLDNSVAMLQLFQRTVKRTSEREAFTSDDLIEFERHLHTQREFWDIVNNM